jgi:hypothetical protein
MNSDKTLSRANLAADLRRAIILRPRPGLNSAEETVRLYYKITGREWHGTIDDPVFLMEGHFVMQEDAVDGVSVIWDYIKQKRRVDRVFRKWQTETKNQAIRLWSVAWYGRQTALIDERFLRQYLLRVARIGSQDQTEDLLEIVKLDILIRRVAEESIFATALPLRTALERYIVVRDQYDYWWIRVERMKNGMPLEGIEKFISGGDFYEPCYQDVD